MATEYQAADPFSRPSFRSLRDFILETPQGSQHGPCDLEEFERALHRKVMAWEAEMVGEHLKKYDLRAQEIEVAGERYRWKMQTEQEYCGLAGTFTIERSLYVPRSGDGKAICPLEMRAGMVEGAWTPLAARVMARAVASTTPKEAEKLLEEIGGMKPSGSSLDRLPKRLSEVWEEKREVFETEIRTLEPVPRSAVAVGVSLDGVLVPLKDADRVEKRSQDDKRPQGPAGFGEVGCGTITLYDREGEPLQTIRYARMPEHKKETLKSQLRNEVESILGARPQLKLVSLADGAEDNWEFLSELSEKFGDGERKREAIDIFHVLERVKKALDAYHGEGTAESKAVFEECRVWLKETDDGAERVIRALRYRRDESRGARKTAINTQVRYLTKRRERLRYKELLDEKLPIGSGIVEAACKTLATERMKRSGMSWREEGGQAVLTLRSLIQSGRWELGWGMLSAEYRCEVRVTKAAAA